VRRTDPVGDPPRQDARAGAGVGQPAVVSARHLRDDQRLRGLRAIDDTVCLLIRGIHIVGTGELWRLTALVVTAAATIRAANVLPEVDAERLNIRRRGRRARVARTGIRT